MLLTEADTASLAKKQSLIDRLKKDLTAAGIKFREVGSTSIDIFNTVTVAQPIYTATANKNGSISVVDKSAERLSVSDLPDGADPLFGNFNDRGKLMSLDFNDNNYKTTYYDVGGQLGVRSHYISNSVVLVDGNNISKSDSGEILYGHIKFDSKLGEYLASIDVVRNGEVITFKKPGKRARKKDPTAMYDWFKLTSEFYHNKNHISQEALYKASADYIIQTIENSTVNAAIKGGKDKYVIEPAKELVEDLKRVFGNAVTDNLNSVANTNANNPIININYKDGITLNIIMRRPNLGARGVLTSVYNTDKTLLYVDVRKNISAINDPTYKIEVGKFIDSAQRDENGKLQDFEFDSLRIVTAIVNYVKANESKLQLAIKNKNEQQDLIAKMKVANDERKAQMQRDAIRSDKIFAREEEARLQAEEDKRDAERELNAYADRKHELMRKAKTGTKRGDLAKAVDDFTKDPDAYDKFLDSIVDKF